MEKESLVGFLYVVLKETIFMESTTVQSFFKIVYSGRLCRGVIMLLPLNFLLAKGAKAL